METAPNQKHTVEAVAELEDAIAAFEKAEDLMSAALARICHAVNWRLSNPQFPLDAENAHRFQMAKDIVLGVRLNALADELTTSYGANL